MKKIALLTFVILGSLYGAQTTKSFECTKIFEDRKNELLVELERIDEQKQSLDSLKRATEDLLRKKEAMVQGKDIKVDKKIKEIKDKEESVKKMLDENKKVLDQIKQLKSDKVSQTFAEMKP